MAEEKKNEAMSDEELDQIIQDMAKADEEAIPEAPLVAALSEPAPKKTRTVLAEVPEVETEEMAPVAKFSPRVEKKTEPRETSKTSGQALTMELQGVVNLRLSFASGGRSIEIVCSEDALVCTMADGTEFRIPTGLAAKKHAA